MRIPSIAVSVDGPLAALYPGREPFLFTFPGEANALSGVSAFLNDQGPHWHYVGYGLRPRFAFELSFRLALQTTDDPLAPSWPGRLMLAFAEHALKQARAFERGHYLCFPDRWAEHAPMRCGVLVEDRQLGAEWLQIVGLHEDELGMVSGDGWRELVGALTEEDPLLVTRPERRSVVPPGRLKRSGRSS